MIQSPLFWITLSSAVIAFWTSPRRYRYGVLACISIGYLVLLSPRNVLVLILWTLLFFYCAPLSLTQSRARRWITPFLIVLSLGYLAFFKYIPPIISAIASSRLEEQIVIPIGISYFTFKFVHYAIEVSRGNVKDRSLQSFFCYIFLFPIFTAGPIERFDHFLSNREECWSLQSTVYGLTRIIHGLIKRFFVGGLVIEPMYKSLNSVDVLLSRLSDLPVYKVWAYLVLTFLYVYMDFSAYSDIAVGSSRLFGLRIAENFNWPILAQNISDFWRRWHITLSGWCQTYVYMPMIGITRNPYIAAYACLLAIGLWHSGTWTRICWGLYHGTGVAVYTTWGRYKRKRGWHFLNRGYWPYLGVPVTFLFVTCSMPFLVVEKKRGLYDAIRILAKLVAIDLPA